MNGHLAISQDEARRAIREFIRDTMMYRLSAPISDSESLIRTGLLDSLSMLTLIAFLEERFEMAVTDDEVDPENFGTIDQLTAFVSRKLARVTSQVA